MTVWIGCLFPWMVRKSRDVLGRKINSGWSWEPLSHHTWPFLLMLIHWYSEMYCKWFRKRTDGGIYSNLSGRKIMRTLIGMIHSCAGHNKQLCFHIEVRLRSFAAATVRSCFPLPVQFWRLSWGYEDVPVLSHGPVKLGPLFLGSMPPHKPLPEELYHAPLSLVCRQGTQGIIHSIW